MNIDLIKAILIRNQAAKENTYLVPSVSFDGFIRDELMFVRQVDDEACTVWRSMDGKLYYLSKDQIEKFKCVGAC